MTWAFTSGFTPADDAELADMARQLYGLEVTHLQRLPSERDDTAIVDTSRGRGVLKLAHPSDDPHVIRQRVGLMDWLSGRSLPFRTAGVWRSLSGSLVDQWAGRHVTLVDYLPGEPLRRGGLALDDLSHLGVAIARLQATLADYPGDYLGEHVWNLADLQLLGPALRELHEEPWHAAVSRVIDVARETTLRQVSQMPVQVCHNDVHGDNVLMDSETQRMVGLVDWGDSVVTPPVVDVAVAASYTRGYLAPQWTPDDPWAPARALVSGWATGRDGGVVSSDEWVLLTELVLLRLLQRLVLNSAVSRHAGDGGVYASRNRERTLADFGELWQTRPDLAFPSMERAPLW